LITVGTQPVLAVVAILAWALFASSAPASMQSRSMSLAGPAGGLVAALPASAASAGMALGSTVSGAAYTVAGPTAVILTGMALALGALALAVATRRLRPPVETAPRIAHHESDALRMLRRAATHDARL
jgi:MFS transporter, DHA1 family, inner membrane transport protein